MRKVIITSLFLLGIRGYSYGQVDLDVERASRQKVQLMLADVIEITFTNTNSMTGPMVDLNFKTSKDYFEGVESVPQTLKVRSNREFTVSVRTNSTTMTYQGQAADKNRAVAAQALNIRVPVNRTGGTIAAPFSEDNYRNLPAQDKMLIDAGNRGNDQSFSVQYKAKPNVEYAPGEYTVDVIYTASRS